MRIQPKQADGKPRVFRGYLFRIRTNPGSGMATLTFSSRKDWGDSRAKHHVTYCDAGYGLRNLSRFFGGLAGTEDRKVCYTLTEWMTLDQVWFADERGPA